MKHMSRLHFEIHLCIDNSFFYYQNNFSILSNFSLQLTSGITVLMGPNGCGKSTLLRILAGLTRLDSGSVGWGHEGGKRIIACEYLPQDYRRALFPWRTVRGNLWPWSVGRAASEVWPIPAAENLDAALIALGLSNLSTRRPWRLSGGQQQMTLLARCVVSPAPLAVLDEPFSALDVVRREVAARVLRAAALSDGRVMVAAIP